MGVKITPKEKRITSARMTTTVRREERRAERERIVGKMGGGDGSSVVVVCQWLCWWPLRLRSPWDRPWFAVSLLWCPWVAEIFEKNQGEGGGTLGDTPTGPVGVASVDLV